MPQTVSRGRFVWHELMTPDPEAAQKFYTQVVGWKTEAWDQNTAYIMWMTDSGPIGGLMTLPAEAKLQGAPPHWLAYISTPDVDATVADAARLGGRVLKPATDIPEVGRFAILADPQSAVFAAFTPLSPMAQSDTPQVGGFSWHELATTDPAAAFGFYQTLFGWEKTDAMDMGPNGVYQMFGWDGKSMGGVYRKPKEMPSPPNWLGYVHIRDTNKAIEKIKKAGGKVLNGPMEVPGGDLIAQGIDPQGAAFAVHSLNPAATAKAKTPAAAAKAGTR
ncbi:MAG: VOC family protein [Deltaproteobacteria bacterium]